MNIQFHGQAWLFPTTPMSNSHLINIFNCSVSWTISDANYATLRFHLPTVIMSVIRNKWQVLKRTWRKSDPYLPAGKDICTVGSKLLQTLWKLVYRGVRLKTEPPYDSAILWIIQELWNQYVKEIIVYYFYICFI